MASGAGSCSLPRIFRLLVAQGKRNLSIISKIILHCSANSNPAYTAADVRYDHIHNRGFDDIGYHWFIRTSGLTELGRPITEVGAHCFGHNWDSVGICLNGLESSDFNQDQFKSLCLLLTELHGEIATAKIYPHHFFNAGKLCPVYSCGQFQDFWAKL